MSQKGIRDFGGFINGLVDFTRLDKGLPGKIGFTDLDGLCERKGQFLVIEKKGSNKPLPIGQKITFSSMLKLNVFTIIIYWGDESEETVQVAVSKPGETLNLNRVDMTVEDLNRLIGEWYVKASR